MDGKFNVMILNQARQGETFSFHKQHSWGAVENAGQHRY